jgi:hypothetical protein
MANVGKGGLKVNLRSLDPRLIKIEDSRDERKFKDLVIKVFEEIVRDRKALVAENAGLKSRVTRMTEKIKRLEESLPKDPNLITIDSIDDYNVQDEIDESEKLIDELKDFYGEEDLKEQSETDQES